MKNLWIYYSIIGMMTTGLTGIILKLLQTSQFDILILLACGYLISGLFAILYIINKFNDFIYMKNNIPLSFFLYIIVFSCLHMLSQYFISNAFAISPNMGYCHLIINLNIIISLLARYFLFKQNVNFQTFIGIFIALFGVGIVIYYSNN